MGQAAAGGAGPQYRALHIGFGSLIAQVVEVSVER
jgi:hypothetical protein